MKTKTFPGGIHPAYNKISAHSAIRDLPEPPQVVIPLHQHTGAPCQPLVQKGDQVHVGQKVGDVQAAVAAPVHASVAGKVVAVEPRPHPAGRDTPAVVIEGDGTGATVDLSPYPDPDDLSPPELQQIIREGGIVGLGGAAFPTAVKLRPPAGTVIDTYLLNGAECEPFLTADHRLMVENPESIVLGLRALMKAAGAGKAVVAIEDNK
ncbi:MAG TPA: electron transport complex subunit RsxC, partial [Firmicutes bacterium]|nr:electron transport complex subunit RsxC [Bacillota bacterium]